MVFGIGKKKKDSDLEKEVKKTTYTFDDFRRAVNSQLGKLKADYHDTMQYIKNVREEAKEAYAESGDEQELADYAIEIDSAEKDAKNVLKESRILRKLYRKVRTIFRRQEREGGEMSVIRAYTQDIIASIPEQEKSDLGSLVNELEQSTQYFIKDNINDIGYTELTEEQKAIKAELKAEVDATYNNIPIEVSTENQIAEGAGGYSKTPKSAAQM